MPNINNVSWREAFNNDNGKTSGNKLIGITTSFVCLSILVACTIYYFIVPDQGETVLELLDKVIFFYITGCGTMGIKTISTHIGGNSISTTGKHKKPKQQKNGTDDKKEE